MDRLIVSGSVDRTSDRDERTPIGWVLDRLRLGEELDRADGARPVEVERGNAGVVLRVDRFDLEAEAAAARAAEVDVEVGEGEGQLVLFEGAGEEIPPAAPRLRDLVGIPTPPPVRVARLSYSAISLFDRCGYRYYAERVAGMKPAPWEQQGDGVDGEHGGGGLHPTEIGDAVHRLLELVDLAAARRPGSRRARRARARLVSGCDGCRGAADRRARERRTPAPRSPLASRGSRERARSGRSRSSSTACS